jgi:uncharacterized HAD superfamily protein
MKPLFCIDLDNVVANTDEVIRRIIAEVTLGRVKLEYTDIKSFNYYECTDDSGNQLTKEEWYVVHNRYSEPQTILNVSPIQDAVRSLNLLAECGEIHFATSRLLQARKATADWLAKHDFPKHSLHFLGHGKKHLALERFHVAVEDHYEQAVLFATEADTPAYLMRHPWNASRLPKQGVFWVGNWHELTMRIVDSVQTQQI